jgi:hypothetical protein
MEIKSVKFLVVLVITFVIVFLMNYIGNTQPDKLQRALLNGLGVLHFLARARHILFITTVGAGHGLSALADGGAVAVHRPDPAFK